MKTLADRFNDLWKAWAEYHLDYKQLRDLQDAATHFYRTYNLPLQ